MSEHQRTRPALPVRAASGAWQFINPRLKAGRIPYTRTMLVMLFVAAAVFVFYTLVKKDVQLPFSSKPYYVEVLLPDAKGLNPPKEPAVGVAGVPAGKVVGAKVEHGQARIRMRLDPEMKGKIFRNASAFVRPTSILQTLIVNITPGDPRTGALPDGKVIPASRTATFVSIDDLTGILDTGTQAHVQVLLGEAAKALTGREPEIQKILAKVGRLTDGVTPLARSLAERRKLLSSLTANLDRLMTTLGDRGRQLASAVDLGSRTLAITDKRAPELAAATRGLAPTLAEARRALDASRGLSGTLIPAHDAQDPVAPQLQPTADKLSELAPVFSRFVDKGKQVIDVGHTPVRQLAAGLKGQEARVRRDQIPALEELGRLAKLMHTYRNGIVQFANNISGATSTVRRGGIAAQVAVVDLTTDPTALGLTSRQARERVGGSTRMGRMLAKMLEYTCRESNPAACLLRFNIPGLPAKPVLTPRPASGTGG
jgi:virulence factor Mce-like protein